MNLFGKKRDPVPPPTTAPAAPAGGSNQAAIVKVKDTIETMGKRQEHLLRKVNLETKNAMQYSKTNKKKEAIACLKRKKMFEKQVEQIANTMLTLETQLLTLESMNINREALEAQKFANAAIGEEVRKMGGVDAVAEVIDNVEEGLQDAHEIQEELGRVVGMPGIDDDEDELLAELEGLEEEQLAEEIGKVDLGTNAEALKGMPKAPQEELLSLPAAGTKKVAAMTDEERELAELEASMAM